jgi:hypothetical protein
VGGKSEVTVDTDEDVSLLSPIDGIVGCAESDVKDPWPTSGTLTVVLVAPLPSATLEVVPVPTSGRT